MVTWVCRKVNGSPGGCVEVKINGIKVPVRVFCIVSCVNGSVG